MHNIKCSERLRFAVLGVIPYMKMNPTSYWCYTVESLLIKSWCKQPAPLPVALRAFYHICCFEMFSIIFVFVLFFSLFPDIPIFLCPCCNLNFLHRWSKIKKIHNGFKMFVFSHIILFEQFLFVSEFNFERLIQYTFLTALMHLHESVFIIIAAPL